MITEEDSLFSSEILVPDLNTISFDLSDLESPNRPKAVFKSLDHLVLEELEEQEEVEQEEPDSLSDDEQWCILEIVPSFGKRIKEHLYKMFHNQLIDCLFCDPQWRKPKKSTAETSYGYGKAFQSRSIYDGYLYICYSRSKSDLMEPLIRQVPGVKKVIGFITDDEMDTVFDKVFTMINNSKVISNAKKAAPSYIFKERDKVKVVGGHFTGFNGVVQGIKQGGHVVRVGLYVFKQLESVVEIEASDLALED